VVTVFISPHFNDVCKKKSNKGPINIINFTLKLEIIDVNYIFTDIQLSSACRESHKFSKMPGYSLFNLQIIDIDATISLSIDYSGTDFNFQISPQENIERNEVI
jgi:hypothetical protein